jgi:hypothetical protein
MWPPLVAIILVVALIWSGCYWAYIYILDGAHRRQLNRLLSAQTFEVDAVGALCQLACTGESDDVADRARAAAIPLLWSLQFGDTLHLPDAQFRALLGLLRNRDPGVTIAALHALAVIGDRRAIKPVRALSLRPPRKYDGGYSAVLLRQVPVEAHDCLEILLEGGEGRNERRELLRATPPARGPVDPTEEPEGADGTGSHPRAEIECPHTEIVDRSAEGESKDG